MHSRMLAIAFAAMAPFASAAITPPCHVYDYNTIETPCFELVKNSSAYSIRTYGRQAGVGREFWATTSQAGVWGKALETGFMSNFAYIEGNGIPMTAPVLSRPAAVNATQGWLVSFFTPASIFGNNETAIPVNHGVTIDAIPAETGLTVAVAEFPGFASLTDFQATEATLRAALAKDGITVDDNAGEWSVSYAQYDAPFEILNRHNEVWVAVQL